MTNGQPKQSSVFTGLLLILIGLIFLLSRFDPALGLGHLIRVFWPVLIILWGVAKLLDHIGPRNSGQRYPPLITGSEAAILVLLILVLGAFALRDHLRSRFPNVDMDFDISPFHQSYSQSRQLSPQTIPAGAHVAIETTHGDITVHVSDGTDLRVGVNQSASAANESDADSRMKKVTAVIEQVGNTYSIHPLHQDDARPGVTVSLDVELPRTASIAAHSSHGDINISGVAGAIEARSENGGIEIHDAGSDVAASIEKGNTRITGVAGNVRLTGRGNDLEISDIAGDATIEGEFFGSTVVRKVGKTTRFTSARSDILIEQMTGRMELDPDSLELADVAGLVKIITRDKNVRVENAAGQVDIANSHGDVKVSYATSPRQTLNISNEEGNVEVTLPTKSTFAISAVSRSGEISSDFEGQLLKSSNDENSGQLTGQFGAAQPKITIKTSYGAIALRKLENTTPAETHPGHLPTAFHFTQPQHHDHKYTMRAKIL